MWASGPLGLASSGPFLEPRPSSEPFVGFWASGLLSIFSGPRSLFCAFSRASSDAFVSLGLFPAFSGPRGLFWTFSRLLDLIPAFSGPQVSIYLNPLCWAPCFNVLKPPSGLLASIYLNLFVANSAKPRSNHSLNK